MKRKGLLILIGSICLVLVLAVLPFTVACAPAPAPAPTPAPKPAPTPAYPKVEIKLWTSWAQATDGSPPGIDMLLEVLPMLEPYNISYNYVGASEVFPEFEGIQAVIKGTVDMGYLAAAYYYGVVPEGGWMMVTQLLPWEEREKGVFDIANSFHQSKGLEYLGRVSGAGFTCYFRTEKRTTPDLSGVQIRTAPNYDPLVKALGGSPVSLPTGEIYSALERGVVDGFYKPEYGIMNYGWHEYIKYMWQPPIYQLDVPVVMNKDFWDGLHPEQQNAIRNMMKQWEFKTYEGAVKLVEQEHQAMLDYGLEDVYFSQEDTKYYVDLAYDKMWEWVISTGPDAAQLRPMVSK